LKQSIIKYIIGSSYEFNPTKDYNFPIITNQMNFTDDTVISIAIADFLINNKPFDLSMQV